MRTTTITAIAGAITLAFCAAAMADSMPKAQAGAGCGLSRDGAKGACVSAPATQRKGPSAYRTAKAKLTIARERARQQLADARRDEAAGKRR
jgi:hypothetical protein